MCSIILATADSSVSDKGSVTEAAGDASQGKSSELIAAPAMTASPVPDSAGGLRQQNRVPMNRLRQTIASRLLHSQQSAALLTTFNEVNMQAVMELRSKYKEAFEEKHGARLGFMSFFVKASVAGLQKFPLVNSYIEGTDIVQHNYCGHRYCRSFSKGACCSGAAKLRINELCPGRATDTGVRFPRKTGEDRHG